MPHGTVSHGTLSESTRHRHPIFRRDAPYIVWEVVAQYVGVDRLSHIVLRNLSDRTWQKTLSLTELERGGQYTRVPDDSEPI